MGQAADIADIEALQAVLHQSFGVPQVGLASIGGSATWGTDFPEGTAGLEWIKVLFNGPVTVGHELEPIPRVKLLAIAGADGQEHPVARVPTHGWHTSDGRRPSEEDSLAVFSMLKQLGVRSVLVDATVGAVDQCAPWDVVLVEDAFLVNLSQVEEVANRYARLMGVGATQRMGELFCPQMAQVIVDVVSEALAGHEHPFERIGQLVRGNVYANTPLGPFETPAMIRWLKSLGTTVVGQSSGTEAMLARLSGMCFNGLYIPVNFGEGLERGAWTPNETMDQIYQAVAVPMAHLVGRVLRQLVTADECPHTARILGTVRLGGRPLTNA